MSYQTSLSPWAIFLIQPTLCHVCIARFRKKSDADEYQSLLSQVNQKRKYEVIFDNKENHHLPADLNIVNQPRITPTDEAA